MPGVIVTGGASGVDAAVAFLMPATASFDTRAHPGVNGAATGQHP